jgi:hypothetical protein
MKHSISSLVTLARASSYHDENKAQFKRAALSFLRDVVKELVLNKADYSIHFNPGGVAMSGDATLHHERFYLNLNDFGGYWRTCKGQRDYTGGENRHFNTGTHYGKDISRAELIRSIRDEVSRDGRT